MFNQLIPKKKIITFTVCFMSLVSVDSFAMGKKTNNTPPPIPVFSESDLVEETSFPHLAIQIGTITGYNDYYRSVLNKALPLLEQAINSKALKDMILNFKYNGKIQFSDNKGEDNATIYKNIREAIEGQISGKAFVAEFDHTLYYKGWSKVVGYTYYGTGLIHSNTKFLGSYDESDWAGHLAHEWIHLLGYEHNQTFPYSVPYAVGEMIGSISKAIKAKQ